MLCLLAVSISVDASKKKWLKKLAKELGYKLEEAIFENIGDTVEQVCLSLDFIHGLSIMLQNIDCLLIKIFPVDIAKFQYEFEDGRF